jgi:hypothetical protein
MAGAIGTTGAISAASVNSSFTGNLTGTASWANNAVSASIANVANTALNASLVQQVSCFPNGTFVYNGVTYNPVGSSTCGIQEAINMLPTASNYQTPGGGSIYFAPGIFYTSASIVSPNTRYPFGLQLYGAGITVTGIVMTGSAASGSVIEFGFGHFGALTGSCNDKSFHIKDMFVASDLNTTNSIVYIHGPGDSVSSASIATAVVEHCWFGWWTAMINQDFPVTKVPGVLTPSANDDAYMFGSYVPVKHNLVGVRLDTNFTNNCIFRDNEFTFLAVGLVVAGDHIVIQDNIFSFCGRIHSVDNDWSWTSPYRIGAGIVLEESTNVGGLWNGNDNWRCSGNNFIGSDPSSSCYIFNTMHQFNRMVYGDSYEVGAGCGYIVTNGSPITVINPMYPAKYFTMVNYLLPSTSNFSNWNSQPITLANSSLIKTWDMNWDNMYDGPFAFSGSVTALHLTGSMLGTSSWAINVVNAGGITPGGSYNISASWASQSLSASWAPSNAIVSASWASQSLAALYSSASFSASYASRSFYATSASWASQSLSASWAPTSSNIVAYSNVTTGSNFPGIPTTYWRPAFTQSLYTVPTTGLYEINMITVASSSANSNGLSGEVLIRFGYTDELGYHIITLNDSTVFYGTTYFDINAYASGYRLNIVYSFSAVAGSTVNYYYDSNNISLYGIVSLKTKAAITYMGT